MASINVSSSTTFQKLFNFTQLDDLTFFDKFIRIQCYNYDAEGFSVW